MSLTTLMMFTSFEQSKFPFILSLLTSCVDKLVSLKGQEIVRHFDSTSVAQKLFCDLVEKFNTSATYQFVATEILNSLTAFKLSNDPYKHSNFEFINYCIKQFCLHDEYIFKGSLGANAYLKFRQII